MFFNFMPKDLRSGQYDLNPKSFENNTKNNTLIICYTNIDIK